MGLILGLAAGGARALVKSRKKAKPKQVAQKATGVRVVEVRERTFGPEVVGMGRARPRRIVTLSSEVAGIATWVHAGLRDGLRVKRGATLIQIEDATLRANEARSQAVVDARKAEVRRILEQRATLKVRLAIQARHLTIERREENRIAKLLAKGIRNERELDLQRLAVLRLEDGLAQLRLSQRQFEPQLAQARASLRQGEAELAALRLDLARTTVRAPFAALLNAVGVEAHQRLNVGQRLCELWDTEKVEVPVALTLGDALLLSKDLQAPPALIATLEVETAGETLSWKGTLVRFEPIQGDTQTLKAVIEVNNSAGRAPLTPGLFCRVRMQAPKLTGLALPLSALQERKRVYVVREGALRILTPVLGRQAGAWVLVRGKLPAGSLVVVSTLERALEGLPVQITGREEELIPPAGDPQREPTSPPPTSPAEPRAPEASK